MGELVRRTKKELKLPNEEKITFAGRLDPIAYGLVLFLRGKAISRKEQYLALDKIYTFDVIFGIQTDSGDVLGRITDSGQGTPEKHTVKTAAENCPGHHTMEYPPYSSKTVHGKPLFSYARAGTLSHIDMPTKNITVHSIQLTNCKQIAPEKLQEEVNSYIASVNGDFRQGKIYDSWKNFFDTHKRSLTICSFEASVSSGTYIRSLAQRIATKANTLGTAHNIERTHIGSYHTKT